MIRFPRSLRIDVRPNVSNSSFKSVIINSTNFSDSLREVSAAKRASIAVQAIPPMSTENANEAVMIILSLNRRLLLSRWISSSSPTPIIEAANCVMPNRKPSRLVIFAASGSRPPSIKAFGNDVSGLPSIMTDRILFSP